MATKKAVKIEVPPDLLMTLKRGLHAYEKQILSSNWRGSEKAVALVDVKHALNVLEGRDRFDDGDKDELRRKLHSDSGETNE